MALREWSPEQNMAITEKGCSLLVSAGAGSGKTAVLVERIIRLISEPGLDLDKLLVVTFTQAAASEMRERISDALLEQLENKPAGELHLRRQLHMLKSASISTIHAFCTDILRSYFHTIGLDPHFRVADENESRLLKNEAIEELLEGEYEKASPEFASLVEMFSAAKNDQAFSELIERSHRFIHSLPQPWSWLESQTARFADSYEEFVNGPWVQTYMLQIKTQLHGIRDLLLSARGLIQEEPAMRGYLLTLDLDLDNIEELLRAFANGPQEFFAAAGQVQIPRLGRAGKEANEGLRNYVKSLRDEAKAQLVKLKKAIEGRTLSEWHQDLNQLHPYILCLTQLLVSFETLYAAMKTQKNLVDFNDLEHLALKILANPQVADELRNKYSYIFMDEYQDSNLVQEHLIQAICRENNLFLVGDIKQSIYRFRLADPTLFLKKYLEYPKDRGKGKLRIDLMVNYRSDSNILNAINTIFQSIMTEGLGEMDYTSDSFLYTGWDLKDQLSEENSQVQVLIVEKQSRDEEDELAGMETAEIEARLVGRCIQDSLGQTIVDTRSGLGRTLEYKDMVVLLRATQKWGHIFWETLMEMGIPAYADMNTGYFDAIEVKLLLNLLRIIDNKQQDIPLLSTMRSSIGGFSIEEMAEIRVELPGKPYYEALTIYANRHDNQLASKISQFIDRLLHWQDRANFLPVDEFIWEIIMDSGYLYYVGALPGGEQRQGNVRILLDRARQFQQTSFSGLYHFINYLEKVEQSSGDLGVAKTLGENDNLVRIMSIHKSKGLEFPLVIVPGLGKKFNMRDSAAPMLLHRELGFGPRFVDLSLRCFHDTLARQVIRDQIKTEGLSEEMRVLYVAMTRARNRLCLMGTVPDIAKAASKWIRPMDAFNLSRAANYLDWIGPVLIRQPDGEILRSCLPEQGLVDHIIDDNSHWQVQLVNASDIRKGNLDYVADDSETIESRHVLEEVGDSLVMARLNWVYPHQRASQIPSKLSASQIRKIKNRENNLPDHYQDIPPLNRKLNFFSDPNLHISSFSAAEKGTLMHFVMQKLDLTRILESNEIRRQLREMIDKEILEAKYIDHIDVEKIEHFFQSDLGQRAVSSRQIFRELPFNILQEAQQVLGNNESCTESLLVQGVIDMCFLEGEDLVLVDYKTDSIFTEEDLEEIVEKYRPQLNLYRTALETLMKRKVKQSYLYLFQRNTAVLL